MNVLHGGESVEPTKEPVPKRLRAGGVYAYFPQFFLAAKRLQDLPHRVRWFLNFFKKRLQVLERFERIRQRRFPAQLIPYRFAGSEWDTVRLARRWDDPRREQVRIIS